MTTNKASLDRAQRLVYASREGTNLCPSQVSGRHAYDRNDPSFCLACREIVDCRHGYPAAQDCPDCAEQRAAFDDYARSVPVVEVDAYWQKINEADAARRGRI